MATLYQIHSTMDTLRRCTEEMALTWRHGDSIVLLGATVAFIEWFNAYLSDSDEIQGVVAIYTLADDIAQLSPKTAAMLTKNQSISHVLSDSDWVTLTQSSQFDKVVTIAL